MSTNFFDCSRLRDNPSPKIYFIPLLIQGLKLTMVLDKVVDWFLLDLDHLTGYSHNFSKTT